MAAGIAQLFRISVASTRIGNAFLSEPSHSKYLGSNPTGVALSCLMQLNHLIAHCLPNKGLY
uniref:Uncharacterized protein n=1 Tax=Oryza punctata TaxID=4537 RepID=A0A0E0MMB8_ORYPU